MPAAKKKCALCHKDLELDRLGRGDDEADGEACDQADSLAGGDGGRQHTAAADWCLVIHREKDDLVLTLREFRRDVP